MEESAGKAEVLNEYFSPVFTKERTRELPDFSQRYFTSKLTGMNFNKKENLNETFKFENK